MTAGMKHQSQHHDTRTKTNRNVLGDKNHLQTTGKREKMVGK